MIDRMSTEKMENIYPGQGARPRRTRLETQRAFAGTNSNVRSLELDGVVKALSGYNLSDYGRGINCSICGKLYKSKVCLTKHVWQHSVYWDQFDDEKNHDRVLSIQAAIIIYTQCQPEKEASSLHELLVASPNQGHEKRKDGVSSENTAASSDNYIVDIVGMDSTGDNIVECCTPQKKRMVPRKRHQSWKSKSRRSPNSRKRLGSGSAGLVSSMAILPGNLSPTFSLSDFDMSPSKSVRQM